MRKPKLSGAQRRKRDREAAKARGYGAPRGDVVLLPRIDVVKVETLADIAFELRRLFAYSIAAGKAPAEAGGIAYIGQAAQKATQVAEENAALRDELRLREEAVIELRRRNALMEARLNATASLPAPAGGELMPAETQGEPGEGKLQ